LRQCREKYRGTRPQNRGAEWRVVWVKGSPPQPTRGSGERRELPTGSGVELRPENELWLILKVTERYCLHLYAAALSSSNNVSCHIWGQGRGLGAIALPQRRTTPACFTFFTALFNCIGSQAIRLCLFSLPRCLSHFIIVCYCTFFLYFYRFVFYAKIE